MSLSLMTGMLPIYVISYEFQSVQCIRRASFAIICCRTLLTLIRLAPDRIQRVPVALYALTLFSFIVLLFFSRAFMNLRIYDRKH